jgi:hypothetical protein
MQVGKTIDQSHKYMEQSWQSPNEKFPEADVITAEVMLTLPFPRFPVAPIVVR